MSDKTAITKTYQDDQEVLLDGKETVYVKDEYPPNGMLPHGAVMVGEVKGDGSRIIQVVSRDRITSKEA